MDEFLGHGKSIGLKFGRCGNPVDVVEIQWMILLDHGKSTGLKFGRVHHAFGLVQITKNTNNPKT